jgi:hypothetical protein
MHVSHYKCSLILRVIKPCTTRAAINIREAHRIQFACILFSKSVSYCSPAGKCSIPHLSAR